MLRKEAAADETDRRLMDIAIRDATRLDTIITEFLQYARPPELNLAERDMNKILAETLHLVQHEARTRKKITIVTSLAGGNLSTALLMAPAAGARSLAISADAAGNGCARSVLPRLPACLSFRRYRLLSSPAFRISK